MTPLCEDAVRWTQLNVCSAHTDSQTALVSVVTLGLHSRQNVTRVNVYAKAYTSWETIGQPVQKVGRDGGTKLAIEAYPH